MSKKGIEVQDTNYRYFGNAAGVVCVGAVSDLLSVQVDGKEIWPGAASWQPDESIVVGDMRTINGRTWTALAAHTSSSANAPPVEEYWEEYTLARGDPYDPYTPDLWSPYELYQQGTVIRFKGITYRCIETLTSIPVGPYGVALTPGPDEDTDHWERFQVPGPGKFANVGIDGYGVIRIYWGDDDQEADPDLNADLTGSELHPAYAGICYVVLLDFLFGTGRPAVPNVEIVVRRPPQQSVVRSDLAVLTDRGQANCVAIAAELLTNGLAVGLTQEWIDLDTFNAAAEALAADTDLYSISLLLDSQTTIRDAFTRLAESCDAWLRFNPVTGMIEAGLFTHGTAPTEYTALTVDDLVQMPQFRAEGWESAKTAAVIVFNDRARLFKETSERVADLRAQRVLGESRELQLQRPWITRDRQARRHASEALRVLGRPQLTGTLVVRREKAIDIQPGDMVLADIEVSPGGASLYQWFRVLRRGVPPFGPITLELDADETMTPLAHVPDKALETTDDVIPPAFVNWRAIQCVHNLSQYQGDILILAERPSLMVHRARLWYSEEDAALYQNLGELKNFCVRATLVADIVSTDTIFSITVPDQIDTWMLSESPGEIKAIHNTLIAFLVQTDTGQVDLRTSGWPWIEVVSIRGCAMTAANQYEISVLRRRMKSRPFPFASASTEVWITFRKGLAPFFHTMMRDFIFASPPPPNYDLLLQPIGVNASRAVTDCTPFTFTQLQNMQPGWPFPTSAGYYTAYSGSYPHVVTIAGTWKDFGQDMTSYSFMLEDPTGAESLVDVGSSNFAPRGSEAFSVDCNITGTGVWTLWMRAGDARGRMAEFVHRIEAT